MSGNGYIDISAMGSRIPMPDDVRTAFGHGELESGANAMRHMPVLQNLAT